MERQTSKGKDTSVIVIDDLKGACGGVGTYVLCKLYLLYTAPKRKPVGVRNTFTTEGSAGGIEGCADGVSQDVIDLGGGGSLLAEGGGIGAGLLAKGGGIDEALPPLPEGGGTWDAIGLLPEGGGTWDAISRLPEGYGTLDLSSLLTVTERSVQDSAICSGLSSEPQPSKVGIECMCQIPFF